MPELVVDPIVPTVQLPQAPVTGPELVQPDIVSDTLINGSLRSSDVLSKSSIDQLLENSGVAIDWVNSNDGEEPNVSDEARTIVFNKVSDANRRSKEVYDYSNEQLGRCKEEVVVGLVKYAKSLNLPIEELESLFRTRVAPIVEVKVDNRFAQNRSYDHLKGAAQLSSNGELRVNVDGTSRTAEVLKIQPEKALIKNILHELMHAASFRANSADVDYEVRSGLSALPTAGEDTLLRSVVGSELLDEGAQEHIRWRELDGTSPSYEQSVMFWEAAIALDATLEVDRFTAKFFNQGRGKLIGKLESIFGPNVVEDLEGSLPDFRRLRDYPNWKDMLVNKIEVHDENPAIKKQKTEAARAEARAVLDKTQLEIYTSRGLGFSDEQLRETKKTGIVPDEPDHKAH